MVSPDEHVVARDDRGRGVPDMAGTTGVSDVLCVPGEPGTLPFASASFMKSRRRGVLLLTAALVTAVAFVVPWVTLDVPFFDEGRGVVPLFLGPMLFAGAWALCVARPSLELERMLPGALMRWRRAAWFVGGTGVLVIAVVIPLTLSYGTVMAAVAPGRNIVLVVAVATASACAFSIRSSWILPMSLTMLCWILGTVNSDADPAIWAVPNYPASSVWAALVSVGLWLAAGTLYTLIDGRSGMFEE